MKQTNKQSLFFVVLTMLILALACLITVVGCEEQPTKSASDPIDNPIDNSTAPGMATINTIASSDAPQVTANSISISWSEPDAGKTSDGTVAIITGYKVYYTVGETLSDTSAEGVTELLSNVDQVARTAKIFSLLPDTTYAIAILSSNSTGKSSISAPLVQKTTSKDTASGMDPITKINTTEITTNSISISWEASTNKDKAIDSSQAVITYKVFYIEGTTLSDITVEGVTELSNNINQDTRTAKIFPLLPDTTYAIAILSSSSTSTRSLSAPLVQKTVKTTTAPTKATLMQSAIGTTSLGLVWAIPSDAGKEQDGSDASISSYKVFYQEGEGLDYDKALEQAPRNVTATHAHGKEVILNNLKAGSVYTIGVRTTNSAGGTSTSNTVTLTTKKYTKMDATGVALPNQDSAWDDTSWDCVLDDRGTTNSDDDFYWEVKPKSGPRSADINYAWGGYTAIGRNAPDRQGPYHNSWNDLIDEANKRNGLCGFKNWRVPTRNELRSIIDYTKFLYSFDITVFPYYRRGYHWTASPHAKYQDISWQLYSNGTDTMHDRDYANVVFLVRGETTPPRDTRITNEWPDNRYTNNGDGTITDTVTNLMWKQCSEGLEGTTCDVGIANTSTYERAKQQAQKANAELYAGHNNWRLPTIAELAGLVALDRYEPSINTSMFPNTLSKVYWSSTPKAYQAYESLIAINQAYSDQAYRNENSYVILRMNFALGDDFNSSNDYKDLRSSINDRNNYYYVRLVRDAP